MSESAESSIDRGMLDIAARLALRGAGRVEPNPLVGCVIADRSGKILGMGHHESFGGPHAEVNAIRNSKARGTDLRGATAWVTLEPCAHTGKTPPCVEALLRAGIGRLVIARTDPNPIASGGAAALESAGVEVRVAQDRSLAWWVGEPFAYRVRTGFPWVTAKWAQTIDGCIATRHGESKWISCAASRRRVHTMRGRSDAILTGIGTVLADDPSLTVRGVPARRTPVRAVIDPELRIPLDSSLVRSAREIPVRVYTSEVDGGSSSAAARLKQAGVEVVAAPLNDRGIPVELVLRDMVSACGVSTVFLEAGAGLLGRAFDENVVNEAAVFIAPRLMGDDQAMRAVGGLTRDRLDEAIRLRTWRTRAVGDDTLMRFTIDTAR